MMPDCCTWKAVATPVLGCLAKIPRYKMKAGKREMFGKAVLVKARPARTVVSALLAEALKSEI